MYKRNQKSKKKKQNEEKKSYNDKHLNNTAQSDIVEPVDEVE